MDRQDGQDKFTTAGSMFSILRISDKSHHRTPPYVTVTIPSSRFTGQDESL